MANENGTGQSGSNPANAAAAAKGQAAAESVATNPKPSADEKKTAAKATAAAEKAEATDSGTPTEPQLSAGQIDAPEEIPGIVAVDPAVVSGVVEPEPHPDAEGGQSFVYGQKEEEAGASDEEIQAQKVAAYEAHLRAQNPDKIIYRAAGAVEGLGGESFDYGQQTEAVKEAEKAEEEKSDNE